MGAANQSTNKNDYAVAITLNESVKNIFFVLGSYQVLGPRNEFDAEELNRTYILLVNELEILYDRNPKLLDIKPEPTWRRFDFIKRRMREVEKYLEKHGTDLEHMLRLEKLCIISECEAPKLSPKQKKYVNDSKKILDKYTAILKEILDSAPKVETPELYIPEFTFTYKQDGTVLINNVLKLKKVHAGSLSEHLLEQCMKNPNKLFKPNLGRTSRNISTILSSIGITPIMRDLFFPIVSDDKGVLFRPKVTFREALDDRISTRKFEEELMRHGAVPHLVTPEIFKPN